jgi:FkbM family methyltransferase
MKKLIKRLVMMPLMNSLLRRLIKSFASRTRSLSNNLMNSMHVSGIIHIEIQKQPVALWARGDDALVSKLYYNRDWEKNVTYWFAKFSERCHSMIDAGANIGIFSLLAAKANAKAVVHAFEPNPYNFLRLQKNIDLNGLHQRIFAHPGALSNRSGEISFFLPADNRISDVSSVYQSHAISFNDFRHKKIQVSTVVLDDFCREHRISPELVKIDVELYELEVMQGMQSLLTKTRPFLFCEIFNDEVKRRTNPALNGELQTGYTSKVEGFLETMGYYSYSVVPEGILHVDNLRLSHQTAVYLLLPVKLKRPFYLSAEADVVLDELSRG